MVNTTIENVNLSSDKGKGIQETMLKVSEIANRVQEVIDRTSMILQ